MIKNLKVEKYILKEANGSPSHGWIHDENDDNKYVPLDDVKDEIGDDIEDYEIGQEYEGEYDDNSFDEGDNLSYIIRSLFRNAGLNADVESGEMDISVYVFLQKVEKMKNLLKTFDVVYKLKKDILPQYESDFELYENKEGWPIALFEFRISEDEDDFEEESQSDDKLPF